MKFKIIVGTVLLVVVAVGIATGIILNQQPPTRFVPFVPVVRFDASLTDLPPTPQLTVLQTYLPYVQATWPKARAVSDNIALSSALRAGQIALIPWWQVRPWQKPLRVNNTFFYENSRGTITVELPFGDYPVLNHKLITTIMAGGTVVLGRGIAQTIDRHDDPQYPFRGTAALLASADIGVVNFKSPLVTAFNRPRSRWLLYGRADYHQGLTYAGIDVVSMSGNHMGDAGQDGLLETKQILEQAGIVAVGAGRHKKEAYQPRYLVRNGLKFAFLGFNTVPGSAAKAQEGHGGRSGAGIAWLDDDAYFAVKSARASADVVIVLANWGQEYIARPSAVEIAQGRKLIEAGADIVLGDQAHWVQNHEFYQNKFISYGLGNYIFDQHWSERTKEGLLEELVFYGPNLISIRLWPCQLQADNSITLVQNPVVRRRILRQFYYGEI